MQWLEYVPFRERFAEAMDPRLYSLDYLDDLVLRNVARVWTTPNAAIVVELKYYPTGASAVHGLIACGDVEDIVNVLIPKAEAWGRDEGCLFAEISSRPGWERVMKPHGYAAHQLSIMKEL